MKIADVQQYHVSRDFCYIIISQTYLKFLNFKWMI